MPLDLNDLNSVKSFAETFNKTYDCIDILLNNAGIMALPTRETTAQGFEKQFGVNHVGHFLLTKLLLDKVKASEQGRIVNLSSLAHKRGKMNFEDLHHEQNYNASTVYAQSKLANVYFTRELGKRLKAEGVNNVKVCALHPGVVRTELGRYMFENKPVKKAAFLLFGFPFLALMTKNPWWGTQTSLHCCLIPYENLESGKYYADCGVKQEKFPNTNWEKECEQLWEKSEEMVKEYAS